MNINSKIIILFISILGLLYSQPYQNIMISNVGGPEEVSSPLTDQFPRGGSYRHPGCVYRNLPVEEPRAVYDQGALCLRVANAAEAFVRRHRHSG